MAAAKEAKSNSRLGQSGTLSGFLLFTKINCTLSKFGQDQVDAPPARPLFVLLRQACGGRKNCLASPQRGIWPPVGPIAISRRLPQPVSEGDSACS
jgi:hypothetical protein